MRSRADLKQLSHEQKDELILALQAQLAMQQEQMAALQQMVAALQARLNLNSTNSSKPPSTDGLMRPQPKSLRKRGARATGGQEGHPGQTLRQVATPDRVVTHAPPQHCEACRRRLGTPAVVETRQVFELPRLGFEVTEHQVTQAVCSCGQAHRGQFPEGVKAAVQYGPQALAAMVHLNQHHMVPVQRTATLMDEFFGLKVCQATVVKAGAQAAQRLTPTVAAIAQAFLRQPTVHADETGLRVAKTLHWMHVLATSSLTWVACHARRGGAAFEALGILPQFRGTLIHDGWKPYRALQCSHGLCNAHHLRELTYVFEQLGQAWAGDMIELLTHANHLDNLNGAGAADYASPAHGQQVRDLRHLFEAILDQGDALNPRACASGQRGGTRQSLAANLIERLRVHADDVWRFMSQPQVPFTNNIAEQAVRMPKVKQKISGGFRTLAGANTFCVIRSYLATMHKQGANLFDSLAQTFCGATPQPNFA